MSSECIEIVKRMNREELMTQLALQCAPLLAGLKISNLLIVSSQNKNEVLSLFESIILSCDIVCETSEKITFLLYHRRRLEDFLSQYDVKNFMKKIGYENEMLEEILHKVCVRYTLYMKNGKDFPHEMGILLGYPIADVMGFIENNGKNFLHIGYWKVYSNLVETLKLFELFNQATENIVRMVSQGVSIHKILDRVCIW